MGTIANSIGLGSGVYDFLNKFTSSAGRFVDQLDPLTTFDVSIQFFPIILSTSTTRKTNTLLNTIGTAATSVIKNIGNNLTGGLLGSILDNSNKTIMDQHDNFDKKGKVTFIDYLAKAHMLVGGENWFGDQCSAPLELALGPYVQKITIPQLILADGNKVTTLVGEIPLNGGYIRTESNELVMSIVNTHASLHERIFYPWMKEVTLPYWVYDTQPYTTATITVDYTAHNDIKYVFCGCRPSKIMTLQGDQDVSSAENLVRQVTFLFDFMFITSSLNVSYSIGSSILATAGSLAGSAAKTLNM